MWVSAQERQTLAIFGLVGLIGIGVLLRFRHDVLAGRHPLAREMDRWDAALGYARQVDVNTADVAELERLPGIGPSLANRIVAYRTQHGRFHHPEELRSISGMGPKTFAAIKDRMVVQ